jgi:uncharacterized membrane protein affecting hemolysin expression
MLKAIIIIVLVVGVLLGGLLTLRRTGRAGMPNHAVLERATKRAREQVAAEDEEDGRPPN